MQAFSEAASVERKAAVGAKNKIMHTTKKVPLLELAVCSRIWSTHTLTICVLVEMPLIAYATYCMPLRVILISKEIITTPPDPQNVKNVVF